MCVNVEATRKVAGAAAASSDQDSNARVVVRDPYVNLDPPASIALFKSRVDAAKAIMTLILARRAVL